MGTLATFVISQFVPGSSFSKCTKRRSCNCWNTIDRGRLWGILRQSSHVILTRLKHESTAEHSDFCVSSAGGVCAVYDDGRVCISILHDAGDDPHGYETASERWSPVQSVTPSPIHYPDVNAKVPCVEPFLP